MIKLEHVVLASPEQMEFIIEGMRNPMNSHDKSDSFGCDTCKNNFPGYDVTMREECGGCCSWNSKYIPKDDTMFIGPNDHSLMQRLANAGTDHRKFMRMMPVYVRITAPLYWWKQFDTYRTGVTPNPMDIEMNSCSTMHKIHEKEFTMEDFSHDHLINMMEEPIPYSENAVYAINVVGMLEETIDVLNCLRSNYLITKDKKYWWQMIQLLPSSYNQTRNVMMNYEVLCNIYHSRKEHKLDEWRELCKWIKELPYSELIIGKEED